MGAGTGVDEDVIVSVLGGGVATHVGGPFQFTYTESYSSMSPTPHTGSTAGKGKDAYDCAGSQLSVVFDSLLISDLCVLFMEKYM